MRTRTQRLGALLLAVAMAFAVVGAPACGGPANGPKPSGGVPGY